MLEPKPQPEVLFRCIHGSRLYGLSRPDSDYDYFSVTSKVHSRRARHAKQRIRGELDETTVDIGTFLQGITKGVPQFCESLYAPSQFVEIDKIGPLRAGMRLGTPVLATYLRTMKSFSYAKKDSEKKKVHALRLAFNAEEIVRCGYFNPCLPPEIGEVIRGLSQNSPDLVYETSCAIAFGTITFDLKGR